MILFNRRLVLTWVLLVAATLVSLESSAEHPAMHSWAALLIIALAFLKVRFVGLDFMELRHAPLALRVGFEIWLAALAIVLMALHAFGSAVS